MSLLKDTIREGTRILLIKRESDRTPHLKKKKRDILSLDKYLYKCKKDCLSKGPKEKGGKIDYHYQHYENIYNYLNVGSSVP